MRDHVVVKLRTLLEVDSRNQSTMRDLKNNQTNATWAAALAQNKRSGKVAHPGKETLAWPICPLTGCKHTSHDTCRRFECYIWSHVSGGFCSPWRPTSSWLPDGYKGTKENYYSHQTCDGKLGRAGGKVCLCPHHGGY